MSQVTNTAVPSAIPAVAQRFAEERGITGYLFPVMEVAQRLFPGCSLHLGV